MSEDPHPARLQWMERGLEMVPGVVSWAIIVGPLWLCVSYPWLVAYFVLGFDLYWLARVARLAGAAVLAEGQVRRVLATSWNRRLAALADRPARREALLRELAHIPARAGEVFGFSAVSSARHSRAQLHDELAALDVVDALASPPPDPDAYLHVGLVATCTEPLETLRQTVRALAEADWPAERTVCAILTRSDDEGRKANVDVLRAEFGAAFGAFIHLLDPQRPDVGMGTSSTMVLGCRLLYRILVHERGWDPRRVLVTSLEADERIDPQHFAYLTWTHLSSEYRESQFYAPVGYFDNGLWQTSVVHRLPAAVLTHRELARSVVGSRLRGPRTYAATLQLVHEAGFWATNATVDDGRLVWRAYYTTGESSRVVPLRIPVHRDAARTWRHLRMEASAYLQGRRWARGAREIPYVVRNTVVPAGIPRPSRARPLLGLLAEHLAWAITPVVVLGGSLGLLGATVGGMTLDGALPTAAGVVAALAVASMAALIWIELRIRPAFPAAWSIVRRGLSYLPWIGLPLVAVLLNVLPIPDGVTPQPTARYRAGRVAETA